MLACCVRAAQSDDACGVNWLVRSLPADWPARCPASTPVPNREPVPLGRCAEHAWIADSVQAPRLRSGGGGTLFWPPHRRRALRAPPGSVPPPPFARRCAARTGNLTLGWRVWQGEMFDARSGAGRKEYRWKRAAASGFVRFFGKRTGSSASSNSTSAQESTPAMAVSAAGAPLGSEQMDVVDLLVWPRHTSRSTTSGHRGCQAHRRAPGMGRTRSVASRSRLPYLSTNCVNNLR